MNPSLGTALLQFDRPVILASGSPRRRELLAQIVSEFEVVIPNVDEDALTVADPIRTAETLAQAKAHAVIERRPDALVIAGDTVVALPNDDGSYEQMGKPVGADEAESMLRKLSGRSHLVITGVCLATELSEKVFRAVSTVTFRKLSDTDIVDYVQTGESFDKAGGYALQGGAKGFVKSVHGSTSNVIGLPVERLRLELVGL